MLFRSVSQSRYGGNFRLHELQAAFLRVKLRHLDQALKKRRENAQKLIQLLQEKWKAVFSTDQCICEGGKQNTQSYPDGTILLPFVCQNGESGHTWNQFVVRIRGKGKRNSFREKLAQKHIQSEVYYPQSMHNQKCFAVGKYSYPNAERFCDEVLALPLQIKELMVKPW